MRREGQSLREAVLNGARWRSSVILSVIESCRRPGKRGTGTKFRKGGEIRASPRFAVSLRQPCTCSDAYFLMARLPGIAELFR